MAADASAVPEPSKWARATAPDPENDEITIVVIKTNDFFILLRFFIGGFDSQHRTQRSTLLVRQ